MSDEICAIYVDMGTTNTRVWLARGDEVLAKSSKTIGVRDTARTRSKATIESGLKEMIAEVRHQVPQVKAQNVAAAGMISSELGLKELPYVSAPAGIRESGSAASWFEFPQICELPVLLVPGVRCGAQSVDVNSINECDAMRGEETLCLGLIRLRLIYPTCVVLNLGSHWKAIRIDEAERIERSRTSLSGELLQAVRENTVLASSLPKAGPGDVSKTWFEAGFDQQRCSGLSRAMFCVRLLELAGQGTPDERLSFLLGGLVSADLNTFAELDVAHSEMRVTICGNRVAAEAWRHVLSRKARSAHVLDSEDVAKAFLAGLRSILQSRLNSSMLRNLIIPCQL